MTPVWLLGAASALAFTSAPAAPQREKNFGVIVLETGAGSDWKETLSAAKKAVGSEFPLEEAPADDPKAFQEAIDRLAARRVKKIIVLPLELSSYSILMDQVRYLLGIRKDPSADFLLGPRPKSNAGGVSTAKIKRLALKQPVVLAGALDEEPAVSEILLSRAQTLSKNPAREAVLLIAQAPSADIANSQWLGTINGLAERLRVQGGFAACRAFVLPQDASQTDRDKALRELRETAKAMRRGGAVLLVVSLSLDNGEIGAKIRKFLDGIFFKYDGKAILPDARISAWIKLAAAKAAALPDMRNFKDEGQPIPKPLAQKMTLKPAPGGSQ